MNTVGSPADESIKLPSAPVAELGRILVLQQREFRHCLVWDVEIVAGDILWRLLSTPSTLKLLLRGRWPAYRWAVSPVQSHPSWQPPRALINERFSTPNGSADAGVSIASRCLYVDATCAVLVSINTPASCTLSTCVVSGPTPEKLHLPLRSLFQPPTAMPSRVAPLKPSAP